MKPKIFEFKEVMYKYGIIFYNYKTDHEIRFYFYAHSAFQAAAGTSDLKIEGYVKGEVQYIEDNDIDYHCNLFDYFPQLKELKK